MVTPTFDISEYGPRRPLLRPVHAPRADAACLRYRLEAVAASAVDVVQAAGGWLYDRAMAGWEVTVLLPDGTHFEDSRPLRILGVRVLNLESEFEATGATAQGLAVSAAVFAGNPHIRAKVRKALDDRSTEVALWGEGWPLGVNGTLTRTHHELSGAARMFKRQALMAAGIPCDSADPTETLLTGAVRLG